MAQLNAYYINQKERPWKDAFKMDLERLRFRPNDYLETLKEVKEVNPGIIPSTNSK